jgi:DNA-binding NarL/FixJ family response regulator
MNREAPPRMLLADHNADVRRALALSLHTALDFEVVGEATDVAGLSIAGSEQADLLIIDWQIVVSNEAGLLAQLRSLNQGLRIIVLSTRLEDRAAALAAGADAFIVKGDSPTQVLATVRQVVWPSAGSENGARESTIGTPGYQ